MKHERKPNLIHPSVSLDWSAILSYPLCKWQRLCGSSSGDMHVC